MRSHASKEVVKGRMLSVTQSTWVAGIGVTLLSAAALVGASKLLSAQSRVQKLEEKLEKSKQQAEHVKQQCEEQRTGRTRAERELRNVMNKVVHGDTNTEGNPPSDKGGVQPIGFIESCFRERNGTPRQGLLVTQGRGLLRLKLSLMDASHTLEGLEQYGHVWIIFIFHENTNIMRGIRQDRQSSNVKAKVRPPRLDGIKVGLFSTRTPHRPNPIGLSIAKVERIEGPVLHLSGIDLLDGTPVLDVKPYIPLYDSVPHSITPSWIYDPPATPMKNVVFAEEAEASLKALVPELRFYSDYEDIRKAIEEVLLLDIRSVRRRKVDKRREAQRKERSEGEVEEVAEIDEDDDTHVIEKHRFAIDVLNVGFTVVEGVANVFKVELDEKIPNSWTKKD